MLNSTKRDFPDGPPADGQPADGPPAEVIQKPGVSGSRSFATVGPILYNYYWYLGIGKRYFIVIVAYIMEFLRYHRFDNPYAYHMDWKE